LKLFRSGGGFLYSLNNYVTI